MIASVGFALALGPSAPAIAYSCRYYYPDGDHRTSFHQIYICDLHGRHRQQITFDDSEKTSVNWVGTDKLAWLESNGSSIGETWYGYHMPTQSNTETPLARRIILYDVKTKKRTIVAKGVFSPYSSTRDSITYEEYEEHTTNDLLEHNILNLWKISAKGCTKSAAPKESDSGPDGRNDGSFSMWKPVKLDYPPKAKDKMFEYHGRDGGGTGAVSITRKGHTLLVPGDPNKVWVKKDQSKCWFMIGSYAGSAGCDEWLYEINWKTGKLSIVADDVLGIDFDPKYRYWVATSNNKTTTDLGQKKVWQDELWCGDTRNHRQWKIAGGLVHGDSISIRE
ncbi:MAG: hypothetical protein GC165_07660 [Armatimonadetes bacterium]|nr:hypothetical protein [Armatimonadota bacterium]